jgi:type IV secretory pathway component VirB8
MEKICVNWKTQGEGSSNSFQKDRVLTVRSNRWEMYFGICILLAPVQFVCIFSLNLTVPRKQSVVLHYLFSAICVLFL